MSGRTASQAIKRYPGIQVQTSSLGLQIPVGWGTFRCSTNLIWYGAFTSTAMKSAGGGKGGSQTTGYTYNASFVLGIHDGQIDSISTVYVDSAIYTNGPSLADPTGSGTALSQAKLGMFTGAIGQAPWSYLTSNFPAQAIGYSGLAICFGQNYPLDSSASTPNFSFEIERFANFGGGVTAPDADPSLVLVDFFESTQTGVPMWRPGLIDPVSLAQWQDYCLAAGLVLSPLIDQERSASDFLTEVFLATNSTCTWSEGLFKLVPYGDTALSGGGKVYTPNLTPVYSLDDDDYKVDKPGDPPLTCNIQDQTDAHNIIQLEYLDRTNQYSIAIALASDAANVEDFGERREDPVAVHVIQTPAVAAISAHLHLQRGLYIRNQYVSNHDWRFDLVEPGDLLEHNDPGMGLVNYGVRVIQRDDDEKLGITFTCEDLLIGLSHAPLYSMANGLGVGPGINFDPGGVEANLLLFSGDASSSSFSKSSCSVTGSVHTDQYGLSTAGAMAIPSTAPSIGTPVQLGAAVSPTTGVGTPVQIGQAHSSSSTTIGTPIQLGNNSGLSGSNVSITTGASSPAGNTIIVFASRNNNASTLTAVSDTVGNTYTAGTDIVTASGAELRVWYCLNALALPSGDLIKIKSSTTVGQFMATAISVSGLLATGALDTQAAGSTGTGKTPSTSTGTLAQAAELVVGATQISSGASDSFTQAAGFTANSNSSTSSGSILRSAYKIVAATTSVTYAPTLGSTRVYASNVLSFKAAPGSAATLAITTTADSPAGNMLAVLASVGANLTINSVTDSAGNTYTAGTAVTNASDTASRPFWCFNAAHLPVGGVITITYSGASSDQEAQAISVGGITPTSALDTQAAGTHATGTAPSIATGTLSQAAELVLGFVHVHAGAADTFTEATGFTANTPALNTGLSALRSAYKVVSATTSITYAPTLGTSRDYSANVLSFKGAPVFATLTLTTAADSPAGNVIIVFAGVGSNQTINSVSDTAGNTYTAGTAVANVNNDSTSRPFYCLNAAHLPVGGKITVTYSGASVDQQMSAISVSGIALTSALDAQAAGVKGTGTTPSISTGVLTQTVELVVGFTHVFGGEADAFTQASGFTANTSALNTTNTGASALRSGYKIVAATTSVPYAPILGTSRDYSANVLSFKGSLGTALPHYLYQSFAAFSGLNYVFSVCIQKNAHKNARVVIGDAGFVNSAYLEVDTNAGVIITQGTATGTGILVQAQMLPTLVTGIWQVIICAQIPATTLFAGVMALDDSGNEVWSGDGSNALNVSQFQVRQGTAIGVYAQSQGTALGPIIFNPTSALAIGVEAWAAVAGGPQYGGCSVWLSTDGVSYENSGLIIGSATYGVLTADFPLGVDPDTTDILSVDLSQSGAYGTLTSASGSAADNGATMCDINGEIICFTTVSLTNPDRYQVGGYTRRGYLGTAIADQPAGTPIVRLNGLTFAFPYLFTNAGETAFAKFQPFNTLGTSTTDLANCIAYPFVPIPTGATAPAAGQWAATAIDTTGGDSTKFPAPAIQIIGDAGDNVSATKVIFYIRVTGSGPDFNILGIIQAQTADTANIYTNVAPSTTYDVAVAYEVNDVVGAATIIGSGITTPSNKSPILTSDIGPHAVTNPSSAFVGSISTLTTTPTAYASVTTTTVGGPVSVVASASFSGTGDILHNSLEAEIQRDGTTILGPVGVAYNAILEILDAPSAGVHTYTLVMYYSPVSGGAPGYEGFSIIPIELRDT